MKRHRKACRSGNKCFYNSNQKCEFSHENNEASKDNGSNRESQIIEDKNEIIKNLEETIKQYNAKYNSLLEKHNICIKRIKSLEIASATSATNTSMDLGESQYDEYECICGNIYSSKADKEEHYHGEHFFCDPCEDEYDQVYQTTIKA